MVEGGRRRFLGSSRNTPASSDFFHAMFAHGMKESHEDVSDRAPSTVEVLMSTIKTFLKFFLQPITFKLLVLFNPVFRYPQTEFAKCQIDVQTFRQILTIANRHSLTQTCEKPHDGRYRQWTRKSVEVKISCPIWMLIDILTFSAEITSVLLQRHSSSNPWCSGSSTRRKKGWQSQLKLSEQFVWGWWTWSGKS